jgi:two-component system cell cycle sensor histidine kinase/response regulator CckA
VAEDQRQSSIDAGTAHSRVTNLEETVALLESILEATRDGILVLALDRRVVRYNRRYLEMFRLTADDLARRGSDAIVDALTDQLEDPSLLLANSRQLWIDPSASTVDLLRFKDGRVYQRLVAPHQVNGVVVGRVASYQDITETMTTSEALEHHRALLEKAQQVAHIGSWVAELDGSSALSWSAETHRLFGVPPGTFRGTSADFFSYVHPDDRDFVRRASDAAVTGVEPYEVEHRVIRSDGELRWMHERADVVRDASGTPLRMVGTVQDVTDRRLLEEQLRQSQKLEAIGRLAGGIAHDLNNALTAIAGYTELALGTIAEGHPARPDVHEIRRAAERAESVTRQLLAFSRKQLLEPRLFSLADAVLNLGRLLERLLGSNIEVKTVLGEALPQIYGDPGQIEQAVINLAVNARDAMPDGGCLTLSVSPVNVDEPFARAHQPMVPGRYLRLSVVDTGHGMPADTQAHIFEPFFTTKEVGKGTGLGLAMVYGTVRQSGGHIFVESEPGHGTAFHIYFPDAASKQTVPAMVADTTAVVAGRSTILVVEDEAAVRNLVVTALGHQGYRVLHASSGEEALMVAQADNARIDLLLTDANMPGMGGVDLAAALTQKQPGLPVVVMSGYTDSVLRLPDTMQPLPLLPKPFTPRELRQKVADVLGRVAAP